MERFELPTPSAINVRWGPRNPLRMWEKNNGDNSAESEAGRRRVNVTYDLPPRLRVRESHSWKSMAAQRCDHLFVIPVHVPTTLGRIMRCGPWDANGPFSGHVGPAPWIQMHAPADKITWFVTAYVQM